MWYLDSVRVAHGGRSAVAVACGLMLSCAFSGLRAQEPASGAVDAVEGREAAAGDQAELPAVVITASRMPQLLQTAPIGATVITYEQMLRAGVSDANEAVRKLGGVAAKSDLNNGREYSLDLRGFGNVADQNIVVLVDGIRLNENELMPARLSAIPLALIDRIEIVRGGNSVMWGDGASSGVVNVILKKPEAGEQGTGRVGLALESRKGHEAFAHGSWGSGAWAFDASGRRVRTDGFRDNGAYKQDVGSAGIQWAQGAWRTGLRVQQEDQKAGLPGQITLAQYRANRHAASTPDDFANTRETRYQGLLAYTHGPWTAEVDAALSERDTRSFYGRYAFNGYTSRNQQQVTPRLSYAQDAGSVKVAAVAGLDWQGWSMVRGQGAAASQSVQDHRAGFVQGDLRLPSATRLSLGWREEQVHKLTSAFMQDDKVHAGELGLNQSLAEGWDVYGRVASSYRLANSDEYVYTAGGPLRPQRNRDREAGVKWSAGSHAWSVRYFTQKTDDEITYDAAQFANVNLDPTQRRGAELEGRISPIKGLTISGTWQQLTARFRAGPNAGKEMVLVSPHTATLRLSYRLDDRQTLDVGAQYLSSMRPYDDTANTCTSRVPSSTLLDARYAWSDRVWTVAVSGTNLTDRKGYNYDYSCDATAIYPYAGRTVKLSVSRQF